MQNLNYFSLPQKFRDLSLEKKSLKEVQKEYKFQFKIFTFVNHSLVFKNNEVFFIENIIQKKFLHKKLVFLGKNRNTLYYCTSISQQVYKRESVFKATIKLDVRDSLKFLNSFSSAIITYGYSIIDWHRSNSYCGKCGFKASFIQKEKSIKCLNDKCKNKIFPRLNPTVIMSIFYKNKILLARNKNWPDKLYSCLAGFCENNESAEEAVKRETLEETNLKIHNIEYKYSQAWPFSNNLMLGFTATSKSKTIKINEEEIEDAKWFSQQELKDLVKKKLIMLPSKFAIARYLIDHWRSDI